MQCHGRAFWRRANTVATAGPAEGTRGPGGAAPNPEQLFPAAYAACYESAVRFVVREQNVKIDRSSVTAKVDVGPRAADRFGLTVRLPVSLRGLDRDLASRLVKRAHRRSARIRHATRGNADVSVKLASASSRRLGRSPFGPSHRTLCSKRGR